jgi:hypothetical protein
MLIIAEVFGSSGDALDIGLVISLVGAAVAITLWLNKRDTAINDRFAAHDKATEKRFGAHDTRIALLEQARGIDRKKSGVYPVLEGDQ